MSDDVELTMDGTMPELIDSDAILVAAYVKQASFEELRRYVVLDLVTAMTPLTKDSIAVAKQLEAFLQGKGLRAISD